MRVTPNNNVLLQSNTGKIVTLFGLCRNQPSSLNYVKYCVYAFIEQALDNPEIDYYFVTTNVDPFSAAIVAPYFKKAINVKNIYLPQEYWNILLTNRKPLITTYRQQVKSGNVCSFLKKKIVELIKNKQWVKR